MERVGISEDEKGFDLVPSGRAFTPGCAEDGAIPSPRYTKVGEATVTARLHSPARRMSGQHPPSTRSRIYTQSRMLYGPSGFCRSPADHPARANLPRFLALPG